MLFWKCFHAQVSTLWAIDILTMLQELLKYPVQVFSPAVITHPILAHHMTTHSQNHFYDVTLSPTLAVYPVSCETLHTLYIELTSCSQTLVCVIITDTLWTRVHLVAILTVPASDDNTDRIFRHSFSSWKGKWRCLMQISHVYKWKIH